MLKRELIFQLWTVTVMGMSIVFMLCLQDMVCLVVRLTV